MILMMHPISQHILRKLILTPRLRYKDLKPERIESNRFVYHLASLREEGFIGKTGNKYSLTTRGKRYAEQLSLANLAPRIQPKIVTLIVCRNRKGQHLLYERLREPFYNKIGFPYGKIHLGETIEKSAQRELKEKTGFSASLRHAGDAYLFIYEGEFLVSQMLAHVFAAKNPKGILTKETEIGRCFWEDISKIPEMERIPGVTEILSYIKQGGYFFREAIIKKHAR